MALAEEDPGAVADLAKGAEPPAARRFLALALRTATDYSEIAPTIAELEPQALARAKLL